jgi:hypothetical protein
VTLVLVDHDMEGQVALLWGTLAAEGWLDLLSLELVTFVAAGLPMNSSDRVVWRFAQSQGMVLLTNNRNTKGEDSLGQTIREETTLASLPVLTVGNLDRLAERDHRRRCAERLVEIVLDLERHLGRGRIYIP